MANFSELPAELIDFVMKRVCCVEDLVASGGVCKSWQSVYSTSDKKNKFSPWLMLTNDETDAQNVSRFFSLSSRREFTINLRDIHGRRCWGSPFGWLITFGLDFTTYLLNPLTGMRLSLPHPSTFKHQFPKEVEPEGVRQSFPRRLLLSSTPCIGSLVIAICNPEGRLYFSRIGDEAWTAIETDGIWYKDAIVFNGQIYAINDSQMLTVCDTSSPDPKGTRIESSLYPKRSNQEYLVDVSGELHLLLRYTKYFEDPSNNSRGDRKITQCFSVYKFDFQTKIWSEASDLGDNALFIGSNTSFVLSTMDYPEFRRNAIYYSDDHIAEFHTHFCDMSIYNMETKTTEPFYVGTDVISEFSRPVFLIPNLS